MLRADVHREQLKQYNKDPSEAFPSGPTEKAMQELRRNLIHEYMPPNEISGIGVDIGCGQGNATQFLYETLGTTVIGLDLSDTLLRHCHTRYP